MRKRIVKFLLYTAMLIFCVNTFSAFTAYGFFDHLSANKSDINLSIGEGFWDNSYIFAELDPQNYNTTGIWNVNTEGFISNNGNIYFNNRKSEYLITSTAILSGDSITHGAYRIYFESTLNENNLIDGYALVFDNINSNVKIVEIVNGNVSSSLLTYNNSTNAFLPLNTSSIEWRQNHEIVIEICESPTSGFKYLNVWIDNNKLVTDYLVDSVENTINNITGYFSHPLQTTFITLDIVDYNSNIFTITFNSDGGSNVNSIRQESGTAISQPANPTKEGYTFDCWTLNGNTYTFTTMPAANITLIASWQVNQYTIAFNSNGGSTVSPITQDFGTSVSEPTPTRTGHTFNGWYSDAGLTNSYTFTTMPSQNITVYAKWTINSYTITFDSAGGSAVAPITQNYGTSVSQPTNPAKAGYSFDKWILNSNPYIFTIMPSQNITLVATWIELAATEYTIIFDSNGGSVVTSIVEEEGNLISAPTAPTRTGYTFNNWFSDASLTTLYVFDIMPSQNMTLYAKWTINSYTISFNSNGGSAVNALTQNYATTVSAPTNPTKVGYLFTYWTLGGNVYSFTTMPAQNITLLAVWTELVASEYTITFNSNGGSVVASIVEEEGSLVSAPTAPTRIGYTFNGWYADVGLTTLYVFNLMPSEDITLYAKWTISQYTITFVTNGGSAISPVTQNYGTIITAPVNPIKTGNLFSGCYSNSKLKNEFIFGGALESSFTLYADWGTTNLTYQLIGGIGYRVVSGDPTLTTIQIPQKYLGIPVVEIGASAFINYTLLQYINIPYSVTTIGTSAFERCTALRQIYIPINVISIGADVFKQSRAATIRVEATSKPLGWNADWSKNGGTVIWGVSDN
ncbi:MAG: InlB B-repeat-containing protein [Clostridia bacterium]|nr:InlB B-repeat-containing protein [Clostridia bacterium]